MEASVERPQECGFFFYSFKFKMESLFKEFVVVARWHRGKQFLQHHTYERKNGSCKLIILGSYPWHICKRFFSAGDIVFWSSNQSWGLRASEYTSDVWIESYINIRSTADTYIYFFIMQAFIGEESNSQEEKHTVHYYLLYILYISSFLTSQ